MLAYTAGSTKGNNRPLLHMLLLPSSSHTSCVSTVFFFFTCERTHRFSVLTVTLLLTNSVEKCLSVCLCFGELCICMSK